jgi:hypothetical protein
MELIRPEIFEKTFPRCRVYLADEESTRLIFLYNFPPFLINDVDFWLIPAS